MLQLSPSFSTANHDRRESADPNATIQPVTLVEMTTHSILDWIHAQMVVSFPVTRLETESRPLGRNYESDRC